MASNATERHSQLLMYASGLLQGAFVVICELCWWSRRVMFACVCLCVYVCYQLSKSTMPLHSFRLCPQSLINTAQTVSPSVYPSSLPPFLLHSSLSIACYFPHPTHTHSLLKSVTSEWQTGRVFVCMCEREGSLLQMTGCPLLSIWNLSFSTSSMAHSIIMCICLCLCSSGGFDSKRLRLFGGKGEEWEPSYSVGDSHRHPFTFDCLWAYSAQFAACHEGLI